MKRCILLGKETIAQYKIDSSKTKWIKSVTGFRIIHLSRNQYRAFLNLYKALKGWNSSSIISKTKPNGNGY